MCGNESASLPVAWQLQALWLTQEGLAIGCDSGKPNFTLPNRGGGVRELSGKESGT